MSERAPERSPTSCSSCGEPLHGPYCSACGESHRYPRLEFQALAATLVHALKTLDSRVLRTIGELSVDPGRVGRDYLDGRRVGYVNPLHYALATFAGAVLINLLLLYRHGVPADSGVAQLAEFSLQWGQALTFLALPLFAGCLFALFLGPPRLGGLLGSSARPLGWIEHYVLILFAWGQAALLQGLLVPFLPYLGVVAPVVFTILPVAYVSWICVGVCRTPWWSTLVRVSVAFVVGVQLPVALITRGLAPNLFGG